MHHVSPRPWMILGILFTFAVSQWPSGYTEPGEQGCQGFIWVRNQGKSLQQRQWGKGSFASIRFSCSHFLGAIQSLAAGCKKVGPPHWATLMCMLLYKKTELFLQPRWRLPKKEQSMASKSSSICCGHWDCFHTHSRGISKISIELWKRWVDVALFFLLIVKRCREDSVRRAPFAS